MKKLFSIGLCTFAIATSAMAHPGHAYQAQPGHPQVLTAESNGSPQGFEFLSLSQNPFIIHAVDQDPQTVMAQAVCTSCHKAPDAQARFDGVAAEGTGILFVVTGFDQTGDSPEENVPNVKYLKI